MGWACKFIRMVIFILAISSIAKDKARAKWFGLIKILVGRLHFSIMQGVGKMESLMGMDSIPQRSGNS